LSTEAGKKLLVRARFADKECESHGLYVWGKVYGENIGLLVSLLLR
jgi:hypothetical protein